METIVVGAYDSPTAAIATERAAVMAKGLGAKLIVVTAYADDEVEVVGIGSDTFVLSTAQQASEFAEQTADDLAARHGVEAVGVARRGKPEDVIVEQAEEADATLIVVGNVRMQGVSRIFGSVGNDVAHHAPCDVLIVKTVD